MKQLLIVLFILPILFVSCDEQDSRRSILIFSKTEGYRHASIPDGVAALKKLGAENDIAVFHTEDASKFREEVLTNYDAVVFLSTTGDVLSNEQQSEFERYMQAGGGYMGIHAAADTEYEWPWYNRLVGGYFLSHPPGTPEATIEVSDRTHSSTQHLPERWTRTDEWYNYRDLNPDVNVLARLDESTYEGGTNGADHPIAWYHEYDGGRAFYTGGGHTSESYSEPEFLQHLLGGLKYVTQNNQRDYSRATTHRVPPEDRFQKTVLAYNLNEPMELDIFPDGRVILIERKGAIKVWYPKKNRLDSIVGLDVWTKYEDGGLGIAIDPNYEENHWIYVAYSPNIERSVNRVSRFVFEDRKWQPETEKVLIEVPVQRDECCHAGGSLQFGPTGDLYFSIGDNTNPFASDGYAPIDERPGRTPWDAQRSSGNTNDMRGGIIRITPQPDGTYTIPEGNLFAEGTPNTRPEIYIMGTRNPFRIHIDRKRDWLYWGDVGPDAGRPDSLRGPKGIDELNLAKAPGNYGWPYFRGADDNNVYHDYNFASQTPGDRFDPENPVNDSPNNTGARELPPFQRPIVWYGYDHSSTFPWLGTGGKNPMAGPVYYSDLVEGEPEHRLPEYFDGKLFFYEWMRDWVKIVHLDSMGNFVRADDFMPNTEFSHPMDMELGPDGSLYFLEYGQGWFSQNVDARLSRVDYIRGNRPPVPDIQASKTVGGAPLTVQFDATNTVDHDGDRVRYRWSFGDSPRGETGDRVSHVFTRPGTYEVKLVATDAEGNRAETTTEIQVGNEEPRVALEIDGNQTFFWDDRNVNYAVQVSDREDGQLGQGIAPERVNISIDYLENGFDLTNIISGHQTGPAGRAAAGRDLIAKSDCKSCHAEDRKINGPSYLQIAERYGDDPNAVDYLSGKIIRGGGGVWGEQAMSAHPQLSPVQTAEMARYILSLGGGGVVASPYPPSGSYATRSHLEKNTEGGYVLQATYADRGNGSIRSIRKNATAVLRHPRLQAERSSLLSKGANLTTYEWNNDVVHLPGGTHLGFERIDLTDIERVTLRLKPLQAGSVSLRAGSPAGPEIGRAEFGGTEMTEVDLFIPSERSGQTDLYFVVDGGAVWLDWVYFRAASALSMR